MASKWFDSDSAIIFTAVAPLLVMFALIMAAIVLIAVFGSSC